MLRLEYAGACYHVINRGNYRQAIFEGEGAAEAFERCLGETAAKHGWRVHAFVIMRNHFHLALETSEPNLSVGMKHLQGTWANRFNRYRGLTGRPFQGRFKALHVEPGHALAQVAHYIHLNPVRAKILPAEQVGEFRWSSLHGFPRRGRPAWLVAGTVLAEAGGLADTAAGWRRYRDYLGVLAELSPREREEKFGRLSRGWVVGTKEFRQGLIQEMREHQAELTRARRPGEGEGDRQALRDEIWAERLEAAARTAGVDLRKLGLRKSAPEKVLLAAVMKATTDVSNGWLCERLKMGTPASVSQFVRRFHLEGRGDEARFKRAVAQAKG
ncbi:MAG: transposase [Verrucomicrobia bacterium]|nr:transposase [Verrucomicrobiota bacterium]